MRKKTTLILFTVCLILSPGFCQQVQRTDDRLLFRGVVIGSSNQNRLAYSSVFVNKTLSAFTSGDGTFSFYAHLKDTIMVTNLGYRSFSFVVPDTLRGREFLTGIYLESDTLDIGEVVILPRPADLRAEMRNPKIESNTQFENAKTNISISSFQGRTGQSRLGDPYTNYALIRERQKIQAYEKGGIPSDRIAGISPLLLIPAAYLLLHGLPEGPAPPSSWISNKELEDLNRIYLDSLRRQKQ